MSRDDIIRMAREAGLPLAWISEKGVIQWEQLERFAALVAERERLAKACEQLAPSQREFDARFYDGVMVCADAIRRGAI